MNRTIFPLLVGLILMFSCSSPSTPNLPTIGESHRVVACLGNSITYGARQYLNDRASECYPALLGNLLGTNFTVHNLGKSGTCLLKRGNSPYWNTEEYKSVKRLMPNVVIIKFGTNDSRALNWPKSGADFETDLEALILELSALPSRPRLFVCTPAIAYDNTIGASNIVIEKEILPIIRAVTARRGITLIDLHSALQGHGNLFPDGIHCGIEGNQLIADAIYDVLASTYQLTNNN